MIWTVESWEGSRMAGSEKREHERKPLRLQLNYRDASGGNFLFEHSRNISRGGIFIETDHPLPVGSTLVIRFTTPSGDDLEIEGDVAWVNSTSANSETPNPGMGVQWTDLSEDQRNTIASVVRTIAIVD